MSAPEKQSSRRNRRLIQMLQPDFIHVCVEQIDLDVWWDEGLRGIILDVDDTLTLKNSALVEPPVVEWLKRAQDKGFKCYLVSNNRSPAHIAGLSKVLGLPAMARAGKPRGSGFRWALAQMQLSAHEVVAVGDRVLTDIVGGASCGMRTCLVMPVTRELSRGKRTLYAFEKWLSQAFRV